MFSISEFIANINQGGLARTSLFSVQFTPPTSVQPSSGSVQDMMYRAHSVSFPGRQIQATSYETYGPTQKVAYLSQYTPIDTYIYASPDFREKLLFERWQDLACGYQRGTVGSSAGLFDIGYYGNYTSTVIITQYDTLGNAKYTCTLVEAWPGLVSSLDANWERVGNHSIGIQWNYRYFNDDTYPAPATAASTTTTTG